MYRIDFKKWWTAVEATEAAKANADSDWKRKLAEEGLTILYSIRAHGRGRVHRRRAQPIGEGSKRDLTIEDQARYVGDKWKAFERVVELKVA